MSAEQVVILGQSQSAYRTAALAESMGRSVILLLLQTPGSFPEGRGAWISDGGAAAQKIYGTVRSFEATRTVIFGKTRVTLPASATDLARLLPNQTRARSTRDWLYARATIELAELVGGGQEQRTFQHWVTRRYGNSVYQTLLASYCQRRFGPPEEVSANIARYLQAPQSQTLYAPTNPIRLNNTKVLTPVQVERIEAGTLHTNQGSFSGKIFCELSPLELAQKLSPNIDPGVFQDTLSLTARDRATVYLNATTDLPFETHILDDSVRFYRLTRPDLIPGNPTGANLAAHYSLDSQATQLPDATLIEETTSSLGRLGIQSTGIVAVHREPQSQPLWVGVHLSKLRRWSIALESWNIIPIGRAGLHSYQDPSEELPYLEAALENNSPRPLRSLIRDFVEPGLQEPETHLRRLIER